VKAEYIEKIYAGWLGKIVGIRLGADVEGWTYEQIREKYGELDRYPVGYKRFAADDDSNGPLFFLRALEHSGLRLTPQAVGDALLNYAAYEKGFFWWGGYGTSTEHTAYLNLHHGVPAPQSGSIALNGSAVAEQIGGQIFIDTWGLVSPGNPRQAAEFARMAASATHGGNGVYGGVFIAVCIALAFDEADIRAVVEKALAYIPADCEYARAARAVMAWHDGHHGRAEDPENPDGSDGPDGSDNPDAPDDPEGWRACFAYVRDNFGYDRYPGACHIIPNAAVIVLALLYGGGDFSRAITICNMCGWDTDCNTGNVGAIMGVLRGAGAIDYEKWRAPINDFLACSSVVGSLNITDVPYGASYIARLAYRLAGEAAPEPWADIFENRIRGAHFEYPGSTHAFEARIEPAGGPAAGSVESIEPAGGLAIESVEPVGPAGAPVAGAAVAPAGAPQPSVANTGESAFTGLRALKLSAGPLGPGEKAYLFQRTYLRPQDFSDSRYDPAFSPTAYPGQTLRGAAFLPEYGDGCAVRLYARNAATGEVLCGEKTALERGVWAKLSWRIPPLQGGLIDEAGFLFEAEGGKNGGNGDASAGLCCLVDDFCAEGAAAYSIDCARLETEEWSHQHRPVSQFTKYKGQLYLSGGALRISGADRAEAYTGSHDWRDYTATFALTPRAGERHLALVRVQGSLYSYAAGFLGRGRLAILKNAKGYRTLAECAFEWEHGREYRLAVTARGAQISVCVDGAPQLAAADKDSPYMAGGIGLAVQDGSAASCSEIEVG
jgi:ADP-ribosylglycohydrolase